MSVTRTRNFTTLIYPDSAITNWREALSELCVPAILSPLHDKDTNADGTPKKPHYHLLLMFAGVKTVAQVQGLINPINAGVKVELVSNVQSLARYFIHKDNPEKHQYNPSEIENFGGADWSEIMKTSRDRYDTLEKIIEFMDEKKMFSYYDLVNYCRLNNRTWFEVVCDNTVLLKGLCQSGEWTQEQKERRDVYYPNSVPNRPTKPY